MEDDNDVRRPGYAMVEAAHEMVGLLATRRPRSPGHMPLRERAKLGSHEEVTRAVCVAIEGLGRVWGFRV